MLRHFHYRYVGSGARFLQKDGLRPKDPGVQPGDLYENELVIDLGNTCLGYQGETRAVIDHHFTRHGQFPSAAAAVLHLGLRIARQWAGEDSAANPIWLVSHREPDFDAYCAMYLARSILNGDIPADWSRFGLAEDGWLPAPDHVNWFQPAVAGLAPDERWPMLLAHYACLVDNCRPIACARHKGLHSVLYAAIARGRDYESNGAVEFFDACRDAIRTGLHPQFDSVLEHDPRFGPEHSLLSRESEKYRNDLQRSQKTIVFVPQYPATFEEFFDLRRTTPLLDSEGKLRPEHLPSEKDTYVQTDAIFIKDPTCLLFKEWARLDMDNSSLGQGFTFTAVTYSRERPSAAINHSNYYFALDYERAGSRHLYYLWAQLQHAEIRAFDKNHITSEGVAREDFALRAGVTPGWFQDPWFDGGNYQGTIVVTPSAGTMIGADGDRADLSDDPVVQLARASLEITPFREYAGVLDYSLVDAQAKPTLNRLDLLSLTTGMAAKVADSLRFVALPLFPMAGVLERPAAERLAGMLWKALDPGGLGSPEPDILKRHLVFERSWAGIWTRHGIALAFRPDAQKDMEEIRSAVAEMAVLVCRTRMLATSQTQGAAPKSQKIEKQLEVSRARLLDAVQFEQKLTLPSLYIVGCLFEATQARRAIDALSHLTEVQSNLDQTKQLIRHTHTVANVQKNLEVFEVLLAFVYGGELTNVLLEGSSVEGPHLWWIVAGALGFGLIAAWILKPWKQH